MGTKTKSYNQLSLMILITIITQLFMVFKNSIVASKYGVSVELDAFNFANIIGGFVYSFIGAGISTVLMPNLTDYKKEKSINIFITFIYTISFILLVIILIFNKGLVDVLSGSNNNYFLTVCSNILIATLFTGFLNSLVGLASSVLEYNGQFNRVRMAALFSSVLICLILLIVKNMNIYYYALLILITTTINFLINLYFLKKTGFRYKLDFNFKDRDFKILLTLFVPTLLSQGVYQISIMIDTIIASRLGVGQVSILNYSNTIIGMVNILILGNITSFIYPKLIRESKENKSQENLSNYILFINTIMCLFIVLFFAVGKEGVSLLYQRGHFNPENTRVVYMCSLLFILSLPTNGVRDLLYKYFFINNDTLSPFKNSVIISILNISLSIFLSIYLGLYGVVLGTVLASFLSLFFMTVRFLTKFEVKFNKRLFVKENIKIIVTTLLGILILQVIKNNLIISNIIGNILINGLIVVIVFLLILLIFKSRVLKLKL